MWQRLLKGLYNLRVKLQHWLIFRLGGVPKEWWGNKEQWMGQVDKQLSAKDSVIQAQRDRIEAAILRETFGDRDYLKRRAELVVAVNNSVRAAATAAVVDTFFEFFTNLSLYETERVDGRTLILSRTEDEK